MLGHPSRTPREPLVRVHARFCIGGNHDGSRVHVKGKPGPPAARKEDSLLLLSSFLSIQPARPQFRSSIKAGNV